LGIQFIRGLGGTQRQATHLQRQHGQRNNTRKNEYTDGNFHRSNAHQKSPNMTAVRRKSSPRTARDEITTVLVVALLIPSEVGIRLYPWNTAIQVQTTPNTMLFIIPLSTSSPKSTEARILF